MAGRSASCFLLVSLFLLCLRAQSHRHGTAADPQSQRGRSTATTDNSEDLARNEEFVLSQKDEKHSHDPSTQQHTTNANTENQRSGYASNHPSQTCNASNMDFDQMMDKVTKADGFLAALDQSGGSTPKALKAYGIPDDSYVAGEESMYDAVHQMRTRIITSSAFTGDKIIGAILFENTMDREIEGKPTPDFLKEKEIVPFIKCDKGLAAEENGVQLMKPMPDLDELMKRSKEKGMFGTKMRSVIKSANKEGIQAIVDQQFKVGKQIIGHGLIPIIEPEVDINAPDKAECETILKDCIMEQLDKLGDDEKVMLKLTIPTQADLYKDCAAHPKCLRVVALSGGYSRDEACERLKKNKSMIASFSRALVEGVSHGQDQAEFDKTLQASVDAIYEASKAQ